MKFKLLLTFFVLYCCFDLNAQNKFKEIVDKNVSLAESEAHLRFLASDELKGRDTGSPGLEIAAKYIAEQFRKYGLKPAPGTEDYFQVVKLTNTSPPKKGSLSYKDHSFTQGETMLVMNGSDVSLNAEVIYANYGTVADLEKLDVKGKILIVKAGNEDATNPRQFFGIGREKQALAKEKGAAALVELYSSSKMPWSLLLNYLNRPRLTIGDDQNDQDVLPYLWVNDPNNEQVKILTETTVGSANLDIAELDKKVVSAKNVIGVVEGTDNKLKEEYVLLSAHYDHIGVKKVKTASEDSIYNGARDNGIGTVALLSAAKALGKNPPKRSVIFAAWTAEEKGLLGSAWYADNPLIPLNKTVYNLNSDGGGYNDKTIISVVGLERTEAEDAIRKSAEAYGLGATGDPAPEQNLFDRSDNVNFARKGIPAPTFSTGFTGFDEEIIKYYHQVADQVDSIDFDYLLKFYRSYVLTTFQIADMKNAPFWRKGDKYEPAGKELYGRK
ncbi:M28 family peptidase [Fulvivirgaceae bacterium BMA10]|uniref:M28 family peptidase n=1 Tax=Splendidivirga corallicola TaxID=3051826 RepID=A0ABT8KK90_9BACT|nr:M28 family peptidase [Fulvivirgaceae bacterium BMA10]